MVNHQFHFNRKFYQDKSKGYWISTDYPRVRAHCWVWKNHFGEIPKGYHVHHKDEDKSNNDISNLTLIEKSKHLSFHMSKPENKARSSKIAELIRPLTKEWHASAEGKAWHSYHALKNNFGKWEPRKLSCEVCNIEYETTKRNRSRFCSNKCRSKYRRKKGLDNVNKECPCCKKTYAVNKYLNQIFCSKTCARKGV
jgi:HNH endonuclease